MSKKDFWITVVVSLLCVALIVGIIVVKRSENADGQETTVAHDHNGDGIPDHDDAAHNSGTNTTTTPSTTTPSGSVTEEETDINVDVEDLPQVS